MSAQPSAIAPARRLASRHFPDDARVLKGRPRREEGPDPVFGDDVWDFRAGIYRATLPLTEQTIDFTSLADPVWRLTAKEYLYARLTQRLPGSKKRLGLESLYRIFLKLCAFIDYLRENGSARLMDVAPEMLGAYTQRVEAGQKGGGVSKTYAASHVSVLQSLYDFGEFLTYDRLSFRPFRRRSASSVAGVKHDGENSTPRIPEAVMGPYLLWALHYVQRFSTEILDARDAEDRARSKTCLDGQITGHSAVEAWVDQLRASRRGVPAHAPGSNYYERFSRRLGEDPASVVHWGRIGAALGMSDSNVRINYREQIAEAVRELGYDFSDAAIPDGPLKMQRTSVIERLQEWIEHRRSAGRGIPKQSPISPTYREFQEREDAGEVGALVSRLAIAREAGVSMGAMRRTEVWEILVKAVKELGYEGEEQEQGDAPPTLAAIRGHGLQGKALQQEERRLLAACYVVANYLSGMRDSETQALRVGCHRVEKSRDGLIERHKLRSTIYKGKEATGEDAEWVVIEPVAQAIEVLERMARQRGRGDRGSPLFLRPSMVRDEVYAPLGAKVNSWLNDFRDHVNEFASRGLRHLPPEVPAHEGEPWRFTTRQFRRTVAWFIANRPFGVIAGALQYKHASTAMFEGYAGRSESGFLSEVEEEERRMRDAAAMEHFDEWEGGRKFTAPAMRAITSEFERIRAELGGPSGQIADRSRLMEMLKGVARTLYPGVLNDCYFAPETALCVQDRPLEERKAPRLSICDPIRCPNSCITERHRPLFERAAEDGRQWLKRRDLPVLQMAAIKDKVAEYDQIIADLT